VKWAANFSVARVLKKQYNHWSARNLYEWSPEHAVARGTRGERFQVWRKKSNSLRHSDIEGHELRLYRNRGSRHELCGFEWGRYVFAHS